MYLINRSVAVIKPKQPFVDWLNHHPDRGGLIVSLEEIRKDCTVFLIPDFTYDHEAGSFIEALSEDILENELESWYTNEESWPSQRDYATFLEWFDVEIHSMVIDPYEDEIVREAL